MADLKLIALEPDDLPVMSAHLQDAVLRVSDLTYLPGERRFVALVNRFDWSTAERVGGRDAAHERRRSALRFDHVLNARVQGINLAEKTTVLSLLAVQFDLGEAPGGTVTLTFAGDGAITLAVECVEADLRDLGAAWATRSVPKHSIVDNDDDPSAKES